MEQYAYLDYAAATPLCAESRHAMERFLSEQFYNPSATYLAARAVKQEVQAARASVAQLIGARPGEIVFTAGGSESDNLAVHGIMRQYPGAKILISAVEHDAVRLPGLEYGAVEVVVDERGKLDTAAMCAEIDDEVVLISLMYANNEVGTIQPIKEVAELVRTVRQDRMRREITLPLFLHTDACQAAPYLDLHVDRLGVDMMTVNGGKLYGPKQTGFLYVRAGIAIRPLIFGGGQERSLRSGTENVPGIVGFAAAFVGARKRASSESRRLSGLRKDTVKKLRERLPEIVVHGHPSRHTPHILSFAVPGVDNERLMMTLDEQGFMVATGSACSASSEEASHVLIAMGVNEQLARSTIRLSFGRDTTMETIDAFVEALVTAVTEIKQLS